MTPGEFTGRRKVHLMDLDVAQNFALCGVFAYEGFETESWEAVIARWTTIVCARCKAKARRLLQETDDAGARLCTCTVSPTMASRLLGPNHDVACPMYRDDTGRGRAG